MELKCPNTYVERHLADSHIPGFELSTTTVRPNIHQIEHQRNCEDNDTTVYASYARELAHMKSSKLNGRDPLVLQRLYL